MPSGILDGNLYEFGAFSECFNIKRNNELYDSKYCMGQVMIKKKSDASDFKQFSNILHTNTLNEITPRFIVQQ